MNELLAEKAANQFRTSNGIAITEPIRLKSLLQKLNIITFFTPLSEQFSGMAIKASSANETKRFVLINSNTSLGKQHFTIGHELYHLYVQTNFTSQVCTTGLFNKKLDRNEYLADIFASYLLLPTDALLDHIPNEEIQKKAITLKTILFIEQFFSCSRRALLYRLKNLSLISPAQYESFTTHIKRGAMENGLPTDLYEPGNHNLVIGDYGNLARELFEKEKISQSHYYTLLAEIGIDISKIAEDEPGAF
jgi:Zn-dependent peptidase ImmA (M78 family)